MAASLLRFTGRKQGRARRRQPIDQGGRARAGGDTHVDLEAAIVQGRFRQDLYYRLNVLQRALPRPCATGLADLHMLASHYRPFFIGQETAAAPQFQRGRLACHEQHDWRAMSASGQTEVAPWLGVGEGRRIEAHDSSDCSAKQSVISSWAPWRTIKNAPTPGSVPSDGSSPSSGEQAPTPGAYGFEVDEQQLTAQATRANPQPPRRARQGDGRRPAKRSDDNP
ncbi:hypothetical protein FQR65_LT20140 [Abscondita terminalis]|nr:hypothetical protein FQR65_LT20140 [Abscondita terminalis]